MSSLLKVYYLFDLVAGIRQNVSMLYSLFNPANLSALTHTDQSEIKSRRLHTYLESVSKQVELTNKKITEFNKFKNEEFQYLKADNIEKLSLGKIKIIIKSHKGSYKFESPRDKNPNIDTKIVDRAIIEYYTGEGNSLSSISSKNISLRLAAILRGSELSLQMTMEQCFSNPYAPCGGIKRKFNTRKHIGFYLQQASDVYTLGFGDLSLFVIGKCLEKSITDYFYILNKNHKIGNNKDIKHIDFDTKINILHKYKFLTGREFSKIMSVKWDRNGIAHPIRMNEYRQVKLDIDGIIQIGINQVELTERKIENFSTNHSKKQIIK